MKRIVTLIGLLVLGYAASAQKPHITPKQTDHKPVTEVIKTDDALQLIEPEYNFGKIAQGKPVTHDFYIKNAGKAPFVLETVQASCGCTTPEWSKDTIRVGETSKIKVGYNAAAEGSFNKTVTITYNGGLSKMLLIKGEVWKTPATSAPLNPELETLKNQQ